MYRRISNKVNQALAASIQLLQAINVFDLRDGFVFGGLALICIGVAKIYEPAAWIVTGAALFWLGVKGGNGNR